MKISLAGTGLRRYTRRHLRHDRDAAARRRDERIHELEADAVDVSVERQLRLLAEEKAEEIEGLYLALKARVDNEHAITVPRMHRPLDEEDEQRTEPCGIDVRTLREALNPA